MRLDEHMLLDSSSVQKPVHSKIVPQNKENGDVVVEHVHFTPVRFGFNICIYSSLGNFCFAYVYNRSTYCTAWLVKCD